MKIILIRHAEPDYKNNTLTEEGFKEIESLGHHYSDNDFDYVYSSPLNRAFLTAKAVIKNKEIVVLDWLKEFEGRVLINGQKQVAWDIVPSYVNEHPELLTYEYKNMDIIKDSNVNENIDQIYDGFDKLLAKHGYFREKCTYRVTNGNDDTIVIFCHFCMMNILMSRLFNVPYLTLALNTFCPPTGITTLESEEREKGYANFRLVSFGDVSHLKQDNIPVSRSGKFINFQK